MDRNATLLAVLEELERESLELKGSLRPLTEIFLMETSPGVEEMVLSPTLIVARLEQCAASIRRSHAVIRELADAVGVGAGSRSLGQ